MLVAIDLQGAIRPQRTKASDLRLNFELQLMPLPAQLRPIPWARPKRQQQQAMHLELELTLG